MTKLVRSLSILILIALALTEAHSVLRYFNPTLADTKLNLFWQKNYIRELSVQWYMKFTFDKFFMICSFYAGAIVSMRYSFKLSLIFTIVLIYWYVDLFLFWYNYSSGFKTYWVMLGFMAVSLITVILPERKTGKYKSME